MVLPHSPGPPYPNGAATYTVQDPLAPMVLPHIQSRTPLPQWCCHLHSPGPPCPSVAATYTVQDPLAPMSLPHTQSRAHLLQWCCHIYSPGPPYSNGAATYTVQGPLAPMVLPHIQSNTTLTPSMSITWQHNQPLCQLLKNLVTLSKNVHISMKMSLLCKDIQLTTIDSVGSFSYPQAAEDLRQWPTCSVGVVIVLVYKISVFFLCVMKATYHQYRLHWWSE